MARTLKLGQDRDGQLTSPLFVPPLFVRVGGILVLGGLLGLYAHQSEEADSLGLVGFLVTFLGMALVVGASWEATFTEPALVHADVRARFCRLDFVRGGYA
jgi:hypothetical protein